MRLPGTRTEVNALMPEKTGKPEAWQNAELIDLGCGTGGSLVSASRRFGAKGIGLDRNLKKIEEGRRRGLPVFEADILDLRPEDFPSARYVVLDNVLEHLPTLEAVEEVLEKATRVASRMVYIRHPSFEDEDYLRSLGFKQYWTDWPRGHTAHVRLHEFAAMFARLGVYAWEMQPVLRIHDSGHPSILPLSAPPDQTATGGTVGSAYDPEVHDPKAFLQFDRPVYYAFDIFLRLNRERPEISYPGDPESSAERPFVRWNDRQRSRPGKARRPRDVESVTLRQIGVEALDQSHGARLIRSPAGLVSLVEGGVRRTVRSGLVAAALEQHLGARREASEDEIASLDEGAPVEVLQTLEGPPFVIVGGRRLAVRGLPIARLISAEGLHELPDGPELDIAAASVPRSQLENMRDPSIGPPTDHPPQEDESSGRLTAELLLGRKSNLGRRRELAARRLADEMLRRRTLALLQHVHVVAAFEDALSRAPVESVLSVGNRNGLSEIFLALLNPDVTFNVASSDASRLRAAQQRAEALRLPNIELTSLDLTSPPHQAHDLVMVIELLEYLADDRGVATALASASRRFVHVMTSFCSERDLDDLDLAMRARQERGRVRAGYSPRTLKDLFPDSRVQWIRNCYWRSSTEQLREMFAAKSDDELLATRGEIARTAVADLAMEPAAGRSDAGGIEILVDVVEGPGH